MAISRQKVFDEIERFGIDEIKKRVASKLNSAEASQYDKYIKDYEESTALARREMREEENLSISRRALLISKIAMISAIIAIVWTIIWTIITYIWSPK